MSLEMKYFVLKPRGDTPYAAASRRAMRAYATLIAETDMELANGLRDWADREQAAVIDELYREKEDTER